MSNILWMIAFSCGFPNICIEREVSSYPLVVHITEVYKATRHETNIFPLRQYFIVCDKDGKCKMIDGKGI